MREIIFRGQKVDNGEWAYGYLVEATNVITDKKATFIFEQDATYFTHGEFACLFEVKPETIGQYTGVIDKNGNLIKTGVNSYQMHYFSIANNVSYVIEQTENTSTDPYRWEIKWYVPLPTANVA